MSMFQISHLIKIIILASIFLTACGPKKSSPDGAPAPLNVSENPPKDNSSDVELDNDLPLRLRGHVEYSRVLESSFMTSNSAFLLSRYFSDSNADNSLSNLMGYFHDDPLDPKWKNVTPNVIGISAYLLALNGLAMDLANICDGTQNRHAKPNSEVTGLLKSYCDLGDSMPESELKRLWLLLTDQKGTHEGFNTWLDDLRAAAQEPLRDRLEGLLVSAWMTPQMLFHE